EAHDAELALTRNAFEALAVVQRDHLHVAVGRVGMRGALRQRHLEYAVTIALDEYVLERAVTLRALRVDHGAATAEHAELAGRDGRELPGTQRFAAQLEPAARRRGRDVQGQDAEKHGQQHREPQYRQHDRP